MRQRSSKPDRWNEQSELYPKVSFQRVCANSFPVILTKCNVYGSGGVILNLLELNARIGFKIVDFMCEKSNRVKTYPKKSKSMVESLAWIRAQRPQKKWDAWRQKKQGIRENPESSSKTKRRFKLLNTSSESSEPLRQQHCSDKNAVAHPPRCPPFLFHSK